jgi:hypothetical protein
MPRISEWLNQPVGSDRQRNLIVRCGARHPVWTATIQGILFSILVFVVTTLSYGNEQSDGNLWTIAGTAGLLFGLVMFVVNYRLSQRPQ